MTDTQIVTLALVFVAALGSIMFNNVRITDLRSTMDTRLASMESNIDKRFVSIDKRFDDVNRHIEDKYALLSQQMTRMEENIIRMLGDHETRLQKLEHPKGL